MKERIHQILEKYWGYKNFRPLQEDIILSILSGQDTLALLPTGGGKSICFQVPALAVGGLCLVISPLIALMKDQVENLQKKGIKAHAIYSGMTSREIERIFDNATFGKINFLYISPERLETDIFKVRAEKMPVKLIAIDEAHCISQWGYDFRPSYLNIARIRSFFPDISFIALTATATGEVQEDIQDKLEFKNPKVFQQSFERENLVYAVVQEEGKRNKLVDILKKVKGTGIVYVSSRKATKDISDFLNQHKISADYYHGGLDQKQRSIKQERWINDKTRIIVSTNAFGMGIDKPDVRVVIHMNLPDSLEAYYQEAGRGGRDLKRSFAIAIVNENDKSYLEKRLNTTFPEIKEIKNIYHSIGNYFQIPVGHGKNQEFDFDLNDFCQKYNFTTTKVYNSLKTLEQGNYITFTEEVFLPSRIIFKLNYKNLYEFQVDNPKLEPLIKSILRSYEGVFDVYTRISENELAKRLNTDGNFIIKQLNYLEKLDVLDYFPPKNKPQIIFPIERLDKKILFVNNSELSVRKKIFETKINSVIGYTFQTSGCRSKYLLSYFGEKLEKNCGHCDYCLKKDKIISKKEPEQIKEKVLDLLKNESLSLNMIILKLKEYDKNNIIKTIRWLIDDKRLKLGENDFLYVI